MPITYESHCVQVPGQAKPAAASPGGCRTFLSATSAGRWTGLQFQAHSLKACTDQTPGPQRPRQPKRAPELQVSGHSLLHPALAGCRTVGWQRALPPWRHWPRYLSAVPAALHCTALHCTVYLGRQCVYQALLCYRFRFPSPAGHPDAGLLCWSHNFGRFPLAFLALIRQISSPATPFLLHLLSSSYFLHTRLTGAHFHTHPKGFFLDPSFLIPFVCFAL